MNVESAILSNMRAGKKMLAVLLDPENLTDSERVRVTGELIGRGRPDFVFVGGSTFYGSTTPFVESLRPYIGDVPVVLFPGHPSQFTPSADAILFLSLISGKNPDMLIGWQIDSARQIRESGLEAISMGYVLVNGGRESTTERVSRTTAIPSESIERVVDTAIAGEMLGMHTIYLEAGSGAASPAGRDMIAAVRRNISCPLIVGGGLTESEQLLSAWDAGADIAVVGNWFEQHPEDILTFCAMRNHYRELKN